MCDKVVYVVVNKASILNEDETTIVCPYAFSTRNAAQTWIDSQRLQLARQHYLANLAARKFGFHEDFTGERAQRQSALDLTESHLTTVAEYMELVRTMWDGTTTTPNVHDMDVFTVLELEFR